jgi:hypothetical protein
MKSSINRMISFAFVQLKVPSVEDMHFGVRIISGIRFGALVNEVS